MRVTFWAECGSSGLIVEHDGGKLCHVTSHPSGDAAADAAVIELATGVDLLIFPGPWEQGLALKQFAGAKLLALANPVDACADIGAVAERIAKKSSNVFFAQRKMSLDL